MPALHPGLPFARAWGPRRRRARSLGGRDFGDGGQGSEGGGGGSGCGSVPRAGWLVGAECSRARLYSQDL